MIESQLGSKFEYIETGDRTRKGLHRLTTLWARPMKIVSAISRLTIGDNMTFIAGYNVW